MTSYCGRVVIAGRPNVGKSTLMNHILGMHLAATTSKPQTTRNRILGLHTEANYQMIFIDTPGIHDDKKRLLNRRLNKTAINTLAEGDVILFMIEAGRWEEDDRRVLKHLKETQVPVILLVNKVDLVSDKETLLPFLQQVSAQYDFAEIVPMSVFREKHIHRLIEQLKPYLPEGEFEYDPDDITDRSMRFVSSELIREQLMQVLGQELPYALAVEIDAYEDTPKGIFIAATIFVAREGQRRIVIGNKGAMLKKVGSEARQRISGLIGQPVHLKTWVKVKSGWLDNPRMLDRFSFDREA